MENIGTRCTTDIYAGLTSYDVFMLKRAKNRSYEAYIEEAVKRNVASDVLTEDEFMHYAGAKDSCGNGTLEAVLARNEAFAQSADDADGMFTEEYFSTEKTTSGTKPKARLSRFGKIFLGVYVLIVTALALVIMSAGTGRSEVRAEGERTVIQAAVEGLLGR